MRRCLMRYSERNGYKPPPGSSFENIHPDLRNAIWTRVYKIIDDYVSYGVTGYRDSRFSKREIAELLWADFFNKNIRELPYAGDFTKKINEIYNNLEWCEVYDLVEWLINRNNEYHRNKLSEEFNKILEKYNSQCRVVNGLIQEISDKELIEIFINSVAEAPNDIVKNHLKEAQRLYSDRKSTNFKSSCLESIKAIEACFQDFFGNEDKLGDNVKKLKKDRELNQHIIEILTKINAFRGNDVAHADKLEGYDITKSDAILIHTLCIGFVNYLKSLNTINDK